MSKLRNIKLIAKSINVVIAKAELSAERNPLGVAPLLEKLYRMESVIKGAISEERHQMISKSWNKEPGWELDMVSSAAETGKLIAKQIEKEKAARGK